MVNIKSTESVVNVRARHGMAWARVHDHPQGLECREEGKRVAQGRACRYHTVVIMDSEKQGHDCNMRTNSAAGPRQMSKVWGGSFPKRKGMRSAWPRERCRVCVDSLLQGRAGHVKS